MLCFLWGIWLYDGYLGPPAQAPLETEQLALQSIDRRLHLAEAFTAKPAPLRWIAGVPTPDDALHRAHLQLIEVAKVRRMSQYGATVTAILYAADNQPGEAADWLPDEPGPEGRLLAAILENRQPPTADLDRLDSLLDSPDARWWHLALARLLRSDHPNAATAEPRGHALAQRTLAARGAVWLLVLAGACFVPAGLRLLARRPPPRPADYRTSWPLSLALGIFLVCELAGLGISGTYGFLTGTIESPPFLLFLGVDSAARLLPAFLACAFLFHRARHAVRVFRLATPPPWLPLLGIFSLLFLFQESLHLTMHDWIPVDPTGGLDSWQAGWTGLLTLLVSACIVAPIGEEVLYRGILFQGLTNRLGPLIAAAGSALVFTIVHFYGLYGTLSVGILGFTLALVYHATRSLTPVIILHVIYNLTVVLPDWIVDHSPL